MTIAILLSGPDICNVVRPIVLPLCGVPASPATHHSSNKNSWTIGSCRPELNLAEASWGGRLSVDGGAPRQRMCKLPKRLFVVSDTSPSSGVCHVTVASSEWLIAADEDGGTKQSVGSSAHITHGSIFTVVSADQGRNKMNSRTDCCSPHTTPSQGATPSGEESSPAEFTFQVFCMEELASDACRCIEQINRVGGVATAAGQYWAASMDMIVGFIKTTDGSRSRSNKEVLFQAVLDGSLRLRKPNNAEGGGTTPHSGCKKSASVSALVRQLCRCWGPSSSHPLQQLSATVQNTVKLSRAVTCCDSGNPGNLRKRPRHADNDLPTSTRNSAGRHGPDAAFHSGAVSEERRAAATPSAKDSVSQSTSSEFEELMASEASDVFVAGSDAVVTSSMLPHEGVAAMLMENSQNNIDLLSGGELDLLPPSVNPSRQLGTPTSGKRVRTVLSGASRWNRTDHCVSTGEGRSPPVGESQVVAFEHLLP